MSDSAADTAEHKLVLIQTPHDDLASMKSCSREWQVSITLNNRFLHIHTYIFYILQQLYL